MNAQLTLEVPVLDIKWLRAAQRECVEFGDHGTYTEMVNNKIVCFDCGGAL